MRAAWYSKRDPDRHPVRFLAGIWEQRTRTQLTPKELGQMRDLRKVLGSFTHDVLEWTSDTTHWWRFCQRVRCEGRLHSAPSHPHVGFLLKHCGRALNLMRRELQHSTSPAHRDFCVRLDQVRAEQLRQLLVVYGGGRPEWTVRIGAADSLLALQKLFVELVDTDVPSSDSGAAVVG